MNSSPAKGLLLVMIGIDAAHEAELNRWYDAEHIAERLTSVIEAVRADERSAAAALLRAMTAVRLFDRMLTLEVAESVLSAPDTEDE